MQSVYVNTDGSARVTRTVRLANPTPPYNGAGPDTKRGYTTRWATNLVINLMPPGARITKQPDVAMSATAKTGVDKEGRPFAQAAVQTPPGGTTDIVWEYVVPHAAVNVGNAWQLKDHVVPQGTLNSTLLQYTVIPPDGWTTRLVDPSQYWLINPGSAYLQIIIDKPQVLTLEVAPQ